jgi:hypothetical protein
MRQSEAGPRNGAGHGVAKAARRRSWCDAGLRRSPIVVAFAVFFAAEVCGWPAGVRASTPLEYEVKAAFLFRFAQFVEWPAGTFKEASEPFTYCTIGDDPFQGALERTLNGKTIGLRPLRVAHLSGRGKIGECQVLFVGGSEDKKRIEETLASAGNLPILTVGEADQFAEDGGTIGFCTEDNKIRFDVNLDAAGKAGLKISAKLLALAKKVLGVPKGT